MTEPCNRDTQLALMQRDTADLRKDHDELEKRITEDLTRLRADVNAMMGEAGNFKLVLRMLQVVAISAGAMLVDYTKKRLGL